MRLGVAQIERLAELRRGRSRVAAAYEQALGERDWLSLPRAGADADADWFVDVVRLHPEIDLDVLVRPARRTGRPVTAVLQPTPSPAVLPRDVRLQAGGFL